ncbi:MAG: hypothetical protein J5685_08995 [Clostridiales bacterium]|nr:hypothetical protein [Clostridiales bacterium]
MKEVDGFIAGRLSEASPEEIDAFLREFQIKIGFFQHERLIHLIVMVLFALMEMGSIFTFLITYNMSVIILCLMFMVLLIPYVAHYYFLENSVQAMYKRRDRILEQKNKTRIG